MKKHLKSSDELNKWPNSNQILWSPRIFPSTRKKHGLGDGHAANNPRGHGWHHRTNVCIGCSSTGSLGRPWHNCRWLKSPFKSNQYLEGIWINWDHPPRENKTCWKKEDLSRAFGDYLNASEVCIALHCRVKHVENSWRPESSAGLEDRTLAIWMWRIGVVVLKPGVKPWAMVIMVWAFQGN